MVVQLFLEFSWYFNVIISFECNECVADDGYGKTRIQWNTSESPMGTIRESLKHATHSFPTQGISMCTRSKRPLIYVVHPDKGVTCRNLLSKSM